MKKHREGFNVKVDNRNIWCVLRKQTGDCLHATFWFNGKMYWRSTKTANRATAETICRHSLVKEAIASVSSETFTIRRAIDECVADRWPTPESQNDHHRVTLINLNRFADFAQPDTNLSTLGIDAVTTLVQNYLDERKKKVSARTVLNEQRKLSKLFAWLIKKRKRQISFRINPASMKQIEVEVPERKVRAPISPAEVIKMLKAAKKTTIWPSVLLCVAAGCRPIGTLRLKWSDVNFETGRIRVYEKRRERYVKVNKWILSELQAWKDKSAGECVVDLKDRTVHYWMNKIRTEQKLRPEATLQGCRRTFISNAMDEGISAELTASVAGTSVKTMEGHYKDLRTMKADHVTECFDYSAALSGNGKSKANHSKNHSRKAG